MSLKEALDTHYGEAAEVVTLPNIDAHDSYDPVKGVVAVYSASTPVGYNAVSRRPVSTFLLCKIKDAKVDDDFFIQQKATLNEVVPQYSTKPISLQHRDIKNDDCAEWDAEMGAHGNFVSVVKRLLPNRRDHEYYIAVQAGAPVASEELWDLTQANADTMTFGELADSMDYNYCRLASVRNAKRLAYQVARKLGVHINYTKDLYARVAEEDDVPPMLAEPDYVQMNSSIQRVNKDQVAIFNHAVPVKDIKGKFFVSVDPYAGIYGLNADFRKLGAKMPLAMPSCTGRNPNQKKTTSADADRLGVAVWEQTSKELNTHPRTNAGVYREVEKTFLDGLRSLGWDVSLSYDVFTTVVTKIASTKPRPRN